MDVPTPPQGGGETRPHRRHTPVTRTRRRRSNTNSTHVRCSTRTAIVVAALLTLSHRGSNALVLFPCRVGSHPRHSSVSVGRVSVGWGNTVTVVAAGDDGRSSSGSSGGGVTMRSTLPRPTRRRQETAQQPEVVNSGGGGGVREISAQMKQVCFPCACLYWGL